MDITIGKRLEGVTYYERPGAYIIIIEDSKVATVRIPKGNFLLGGGIEEGETHRECIVRECLEEAGIAVEITEYIGSAEMYSLHPKFGYFHPIQYYYKGRILGKVQEATEKDHVLEWILKEEVEDKLYLQIQQWGIQKAMDIK